MMKKGWFGEWIDWNNGQISGRITEELIVCVDEWGYLNLFEVTVEERKYIAQTPKNDFTALMMSNC
jgi:hypothetical protein